MNSVIIIPALNPEQNLICYIKELILNGFAKIILVNDGSASDFNWIFDTISSIPECVVFTHATNMGKGRALKTAFNYYYCKYRHEFTGIITVDSDGQHAVEDVVRIGVELEKSPQSLILGVRDFNNQSVPFRSRVGNNITKYVMRILIGGVVSDTQTGLRAIPNTLIVSYLTLFGERFEYETLMLIEAVQIRTPIQEIKIQTIYLDKNIGTHFRPIQDSIAIYKCIFSTFFKYIFVSLTSFVIDYLAFCFFAFIFSDFSLSSKIWLSTAAARTLSSVYNYIFNKSFVFMYKNNQKYTLPKYYLLCLFQMCCSATLVWLLCKKLRIPDEVVKPFVDTLLFIINYKVQRQWVFGVIAN